MVMRLLDLFSGIGGFSYAAEKLVGGYETVAFCEQDEFCQQVLRKHWKDVPIYDDVRTIDATRLGTIDIVAGGFPCQAVSQAGLQKATEDDRWLWDEMLRIIQDCKPKWVIGENVVGLININQGILFEQVQTDLEKEGYSVQSVVIPACAKNAPHRRDRVWIIGQLITNTNDTGNRASRRSVDQEQQTIEQGWKEQSLFEPSRHDEAMADTSSLRGQNISRNHKKSATRSAKNENVKFGNSCTSDRTSEIVADTENDRGKQTEWQGRKGFRGRSENICRSKTEREEVIATDVPNTKRMGWTERAKIREASQRKGWADKSSNSSSTVTETEDATNSNDKRLQGFRQHKQLEREQREDEFAKSSTPTTKHRATQCRMGYMANGISEALSGHFSEEPKDIPRVTTNQKDRTKKLKALGNSIVPQVVAELFYAIRIAEYGE